MDYVSGIEYIAKPASDKQKRFITHLLNHNKCFVLLKPIADLSSTEASTVIDYLFNGVRRNAKTLNALLRYKDPQIIPNLDGGYIYADSV